MPKTVQLEDGRTVSFPDDATEQEMTEAVNRDFPAAKEEPVDFAAGVEKRVSAGKETLEKTGEFFKPALAPLRTVWKAIEGAQRQLGWTSQEQYERNVEAIDKRIELPQVKPQQNAPGRAYQPLGAGIVNAVSGFVTSMLDPDVLAWMGLGGASKEAAQAVLTRFGTEMAVSSPKAFQESWDAFKAGDLQTGFQRLAEGVGGTVFAAGMGAKAMEQPTAVKRVAESGAPLTAAAIAETVKKTEPEKVQPAIETPATPLKPATEPPKGESNALPIRSPETVPVEVPPVDSEEVVARVPEPERPAVPREEAQPEAPTETPPQGLATAPPAELLEKPTEGQIVGMGGAVPEEIAPKPTNVGPIVSKVKTKEAEEMESKVKLSAQYDVEKLDEQFALFDQEIGDALTTGGQFLAKKLRPKVAKGAPSESQTVTSKAVNQYFTSKLSTLVDELRRVRQNVAQQASPEQAEYMDLVLERAQHTFRQVQELRRASHESLIFWKQIKAEMLDIQQSLGMVGDLKRRLPILDQLAKDLREGELKRAGKDVLEFLRINLFTLGSWTLDFATNLAVAATKMPSFAIGDMVSFAKGKPANQMAGALRALRSNVGNLVPGERFRLPGEIESRLGTVAGAEFQGYGKEVMADFSEILKGHPEAAAQLKKLDILLAAPVRMKRATDNFFGRLGATAELYRHAYDAAQDARLTGEDADTFVQNFVKTPPKEAINAAVKQGNEWKYNRDLTSLEEKFASNTITKLAIEAYPRWTLQFTRWAGEMLGANPTLYRKIANGTATQTEIIDGLTKAATGWGGLIAFNNLVYDNIDANSMEYVKEDGDRVRLSGRTPAPELFFLCALLRSDWQKAKASLSQTSFPLAKMLGGQPGGIISPIVDAMRESIAGKYTAERTVKELTGIMNNAIPGKSVLGFMRALYDPTLREGFGSPVPGVAELLPQRINPTTGEPAAPKQRIPGLGVTIPTVGGTPFPGAVRDLNDIEAVLMNHGIRSARPRRTSIIDLPPEDVPSTQRREYERLAGQNVARIIGPAVASSNKNFWDQPPEIRRKLLQTWLNEARQQARAAMAQKYGSSPKPAKSEPIPVVLLPERLKPKR